MSALSNFLTFYKKDGKFYTFNYETKCVKTYDNLINCNINHFELMKGYEPTEADLKQYADDMIKWRNELLKVSNGKIDYFQQSFSKGSGLQIRNHFRNTKRVLSIYLQNKDIYKTKFEPISIEEELYFEKCNNGGLVYHQDGVYDNITTFDKRMFYPSILGSQYFKIPMTKGKICEFKTIPKAAFRYGIYPVKIISNDPIFNKIFAFSKDNHYTHISLNFVKYYNKAYAKPNNQIRMEVAGNTQLVWYKNDWLIESSKFFSKWYYMMKAFKTAAPKNKLIKRLASSAWGHLLHKNVIVKSEDEIENEDLDIGTSMNVDDNRYFIKKDMIDKLELIDLTKPIYNYKFRIKPFLTSYARDVIGKQALKNIHNVVRIATDSITYDTDIEIEAYEFIKETKKSGCKAEIKGNSLLLI